MNEKILEVKNLSVSFNTYAGEVKALRDISFHVNKGETLAIVGESGSGKSVTVQTVIEADTYAAWGNKKVEKYCFREKIL